MYLMILFALVFALRAIREAIENRSPREAANNEPLCGRCAFAHIEFRVNGRRDLYCGVGGALRKLRGVVSFCTSFNSRVAPRPRGPVGFVPLENLRNALPEETD